MKSLILLTCILSLYSSTTFAQSMKGPDGANEPPSAAEDKQDDIRYPQGHYGRESANAYELNQKRKVNPRNERGPVGKEAQEASRTDELELEKGEIKRKQKGD